MEEESGVLVANGRPGIGVRVILPEQVYRQLLHDARANVPASTVGALIGEAQRGDAQDRIVVTEVLPLARVPDQATRLVQGKAEWDKLKARFADDSPARLVGWFYADPGLAIFPPRLDLAATHQELAPAGGLLLVVNPSTFAGDGACYLWRDGRFIAAGGFAEDRSDPAAPAIVAWNGEGASAASLGPSPPAAAGESSLPQLAAPRQPDLWTPAHLRAATPVDVPLATGAGAGAGTRGVLGWAMAGLLILLAGGALWASGLPARILSPAGPPARTPVGAPTPTGVASPTGSAAVSGLALSPAPPTATGPAATVSAASPSLTPAPPATLAATVAATPPSTAVPAGIASPLPVTATLAAPTVAATATLVLPGIVVGGGLQVVSPGVVSVNVRAAPAATARVVGSLFPGVTGSVVAGPRIVNGDSWWQIRGWDARGTLGWVLGRYVKAAP